MSTGQATTDGADAAAGADGAADASSISRRRLIGVDVLIGLTTLLAIVGVFSVWANRLLLNPNNWATTSTKLLQNPDIRSATANYVVDQVYANVNVPGLISSGLPPRLQPLASPAAGALRNAAVQGAELALSRPRVQSAWTAANRAADQAFVTIVNGGNGALAITGGQVTLNLSAVVDDIASRLGLPPNLGAKLPANVANLKIIKSDQLRFVQDVGGAIKGLALWLTILVPLLWALAIFFARGHRRRTLMTIGFSMVFTGVLVLLGRSILETQITNALAADDTSLRAAISATIAIGTGMLSEIAGAVILVGVVAVAAAWFAGPARAAAACRRAIAPFLRERVAWAFGIVAAVMLLVFIWQPIPATGTPIGMIVFLALALLGTELLRRQTAVEFPDAQMGAATAAMRAKLRGLRGRGRGDGAPAPGAAPGTLTDQLERLATLRADGAITTAEYDAAKSRLLAPT